ncbi:MAG: AraC family transcriptional regulator [Dysgonamonadaceae bacterium]|jgi:AraC-like DNA-binding protein|nr:AraC family transcriptional regulator [Dysgonamonadaceae bacterium]
MEANNSGMQTNDAHFLLKKEFVRYISELLYLLTGTHFISAFLYYDYMPLFFISLGYVALNVLSLILIRIIPPVYVKKCIKVYLFFLLGLLLPHTIECLSYGNASMLIWFIVIPVFLHSVYPEKPAHFWVAIFVALLTALILLAFALHWAKSYFGWKETELLTKSGIGEVKSYLLNAFSTLLFVCRCIYFQHSCNKLKIKALKDTAGIREKAKTDNSPVQSHEEKYKYSEIFKQIEAYFEKQKPYLKANFKIDKMAYDLNINHYYLSKAIKMNRNTNFSAYVNYCRVEHAKKMIRENEGKYTLEYIYLKSGFKSQPVFNAAFKQIEGVVPSEWAKQ